MWNGAAAVLDGAAGSFGGGTKSDFVDEPVPPAVVPEPVTPEAKPPEKEPSAPTPIVVLKPADAAPAPDLKPLPIPKAELVRIPGWPGRFRMTPLAR